MTLTTPLDAHLALAQRVQELEKLLRSFRRFTVGVIQYQEVVVFRVKKSSGEVLWVDPDGLHHESPESAIRATQTYIKKHRGSIS